MASLFNYGSSDQPPTVVLTADVSPFEQSLNRAAAVMDQWAQKLELQMMRASAAVDKKLDEGQSKFTKALKARFDALGSIVTGTIIAGAVAKGTELFLNWATGADKFNKELERMEKLGEAVAQSMEKVASQNERWLGVGSTGEQANRIGTEIDRLTRERDGTRNSMAKARGQSDSFTFDPFNSNFKFGDQSRLAFQSYITGRFEDQKRILDAQLKELEESEKRNTDRINELTRRRKELLNPEKNPAVVQNVKDMANAFEKQAQAIGRSSEEFAAWEARRRHALGEISKGQMDGLVGSIDRLSDEKLKGKFDDINRSLEKQWKTWGMNADQVQLYELRVEALKRQQDRLANNPGKPEIWFRERAREDADRIREVEEAQQRRNAMLAAQGIPAALLQIFSGAGSTAATKFENKFPSALSGGSREANAAIIAAKQSTSVANMNNPQVQANAKLDEVNKQLGEVKGQLAAAVDALQNLGAL